MDNFPFDWLAPGDIHFCGCGVKLLPPEQLTCAHCRFRVGLDDMLCGMCDKTAAMYFAHGARCEDHKFQVDPSQKVEGEGVVGCFIRMKKPPDPVEAEAKRQTDEMHKRLWDEACGLASSRRDSGLRRLFWVK